MSVASGCGYLIHEVQSQLIDLTNKINVIHVDICMCLSDFFSEF